VFPNPLGQPDPATLQALGEPFRHVRADLCERGVDVLPGGRVQRPRVGLGQLCLDDVADHCAHYAGTHAPFPSSGRSPGTG